MTKQILALGASSSRNSINRQLAAYTAAQIETARVTLLDLNDFEMPIYSIDRENRKLEIGSRKYEVVTIPD